MADRPVRICLGMPCYGSVAPEVLEDWGRFLFHCGRRLPQYDFFSAIRTKSEQFRARNAIVDVAQHEGCDYLLMLDDDMIINALVTNGPTEDYGFLEKLIGHDKDICGVLYYQRTGACDPVLMARVGQGYRFLHDQEVSHGLQRVDVAGGGCLLIKMKIFDRIPQPYFAPEFEYGTDIQLCRKATEAGFEVWADTSIELGHVRDEHVIVTSRNRHQFMVLNSQPGEVKRSFVSTDVYNRLMADVCEYTGFASPEEMTGQVNINSFLQERPRSGLSDPDWYRTYAQERIARQCLFNTTNYTKRAFTEYLLGAVCSLKNGHVFDVLDFGCGIGIPAFTFAEKGHQVTACDIRGTGTLEFLKWRVKKYGVPLTVRESDGGVPDLGIWQFDVIVAMDSIEHIEDWRGVVRELAAHLKPNGILFANNGVLVDDAHPEHYHIDNAEFVQVCIANGLMPFNQITFEKRLVAADTSPSKESGYAPRTHLVA